MVPDDKENLYSMTDDPDSNGGGHEEGEEESSDHDGGGESDEAAAARDGPITGPVMGAAPTKRLRIPAKFRNRKPQDMPRRPLSAYNLFFRDQRAEIMADRARGEPQPLAGGLFESMAKTIAARWRDITPEELDKYTELAKEDTARYRAEMEKYNKKVAEDKTLEAKRRRAENRKLRLQEKAKVKAMTTVSKDMMAPQHVIRGPVTNDIASGSMPNPFLSLVQIGAATYPAANFQTAQQPDFNNLYSADLQMRLLAAHAEGLSRAIPPSPAAGQMSDYIRQMMQGETPSLPRTFQTPGATTVTGFDSKRDSFSNYALTGGSVPASQSINLDSSDPLTILQMLQQQQQQQAVQLPSTTPQRDLESLLSLQQLQINGQVQRHLQSPPLDQTLGLWLQLQQQQQQQQQQAQAADFAWINADAIFYQQHGQDGSSAREKPKDNQGS